MITSIAHVAIKTADVERTTRFYTEILGMHVQPRPPFKMPGEWIGTEAGGPIIHLYGGEEGLDNGRPFVGSAAVDHFSLFAKGFEDYRRRFAEAGLDWREQLVPETRLWQLFVYDPNGVMVELLFDGAAEGGEVPEIDPARTYEPGVNFYDGYGIR